MKRKRDSPTAHNVTGEDTLNHPQINHILESDPKGLEGKNTLAEQSLQKIAAVTSTATATTQGTPEEQERKGKREKALPEDSKSDAVITTVPTRDQTESNQMKECNEKVAAMPRIKSCPTSLTSLATNHQEAFVNNCEESTNNSNPKKLPRTEEPPVAKVPPATFDFPDDVDPDRYLQLLVNAQLGFEPQVKRALSLPNGFFLKPTSEQLASYSMELIEVVRENRLKEMKKMYKTGEVDFQCSNRFGESLIHMACRRGYTEMVKFLIKEAGVSIRVSDDCGRTPFHDALWNRQPMPEIMDLLVEEDPVLFFVADKRGHTPFQYSRQEHQGFWKKFLLERRTQLCSQPELLKQVFT